MIEEEIFKKSKVCIDKLINYGFYLDKDNYIYEKEFLNNFKCIISICNGNITGKVIDLDFGEEYDAFRVDNNIGEFSGSVRDEYINILKDIKFNCFIDNNFIYEQSNRISNLILDKYGVEPEFLFEDTGIGVFRNLDNDKWFSLIMNINSSKLIKGTNKEIEIINIKVNDNTKLINNINIFKAYHMNKNNWISIILDDSYSDEYIMDLVTSSYNGTVSFNEWVVPYSTKYFDVVDYIEHNKYPLCKIRKSMNIGDIIYLYLSSPYSSIMYKSRLIDKTSEYEDVGKVEVITKYKVGKYRFEILKKYGVGAVRGSRRITKELSDYINGGLEE